VSAFAIILYFFLTDFVKIAMSTDNLCWSKKPDTWNITGAVKTAIVLGFLVIAESLAFLYIALNFLHISLNDPALYTFTFEVLFYSAMFLIFNVRERHNWWSSRPSKTLLTAAAISVVVATAIVTVGIPGLKPLPFIQTLFVIVLSAIFSLVLNDSLKSFLVKKGKVSW
jgi:H+-transporting ATPase